LESGGAFCVVSTDPPDGATNVPIDKEIAIRFSQRPDLFSFIKPQLNVTITPAPELRSIGGPLFAFWDPKDDKTVSWLMTTFQRNTKYTVRVTKGIKTKDGRGLAEEYIFHFTTGTHRQWEMGVGEAVLAGPKDYLQEVVLGRPSEEQKKDAGGRSQKPAFPTNEFGPNDWVFVYLSFTNLTLGKHTLQLKWYHPDGKLFMTQRDDTDTEKNPLYLAGFQLTFYRQPGVFGDPVGKHKIEIVWDGKVIKTLEYEVKKK
jgi:hypothetical protein